MFTGLIETVGRVERTEHIPGGSRITVEAPFDTDVVPGESIAVNGACLTVVAVERNRLSFDAGPETLRVTALGRLVPGQAVNLERAMRADTRVGGHFVQGHVDATGQLLAVRPEADFVWMTFSFPREHETLLIPKGAVAVDGISLTVARLENDRFDVQIVPFTWSHTNLSALDTGALVNLEFDMLGKYAVRAAERAARATPVVS